MSGTEAYAAEADALFVQWAAREGLRLVLTLESNTDNLRRPDVRWTRLAFAKAGTQV
jgi:hypothetical protein